MLKRDTAWRRIRPSVRLEHAGMDCLKTNNRRLMGFTPSDSQETLCLRARAFTASTNSKGTVWEWDVSRRIAYAWLHLERLSGIILLLSCNKLMASFLSFATLNGTEVRGLLAIFWSFCANKSQKLWAICLSLMPGSERICCLNLGLVKSNDRDRGNLHSSIISR